MADEFIACSIKQLPAAKQADAADLAIDYNPANRPSPGRLIQTVVSFFTELISDVAPIANDKVSSLSPTREELAVVTTKFWGSSGIVLTVGFPFDQTPADVQARIVGHMNAWSQFCNVKFVLTKTDPQVRINRAPDGYWSYLGTDILAIPRNQPTMNLQNFTMSTPEAEYRRVVRHETGHTLGFPHEHMRQELVARLDPAKTIAYFRSTQGWSPQQTQQQVLTPVSEASIRGTPNADQDSIMCYQLPAIITIDGQPIRGGSDIDQLDADFAGKLYPLPVPPPPPPPPPPVTGNFRAVMTLEANPTTKTIKVV